MTMDLREVTGIGDRLAALEAVNAEMSMRVSNIERLMQVQAVAVSAQWLNLARAKLALDQRVKALEAGICPELEADNG